MKLEKAVKDFIVECEVRRYTPKTIKGYKTHLNVFCRFCEEELEVTDLDDVDMSVVKKFTHIMLQKGYKATYVNSHLKVLKSFIQHCWDEDLGGFDTKKKQFKWCKEEQPIIKPFAPSDIKLLLKNCQGNDFLSVRDAAIITMFIDTGIRCAELYSIRPQDVKDDYITIVNGKGRKERFVGITPILKKALIRYERVKDNYFSYKNTEDFYFLSQHGRMLTNSAVEHLIKRRADGINPENVRISPHTLRHAFAVQSLKQGRDLYSISAQLGHTNLKTTAIYLKTLTQEEIVQMAKNNSVLMNL